MNNYQIVIIIILLINVGVVIASIGKPRDDYSFLGLIDAVITAVLIMGSWGWFK